MSDKHEYGGRFLYAEDLLIGGEFKSYDLKIESFHDPLTLEAASGERIKKPAIGFAGTEKLLVLCKTNISVLIYVTGEQPGPNWIGKGCKIQARIVDSFGEKTTAIRIIPPVGATLRKNIIKRLGEPAFFQGGAS